ncbi:thiamine diphosphokinase [bacterium]|nr:MAG: thiamine diphosphokinase [bacterium]
MIISSTSSVLVICDGLIPDKAWVFSEWQQHQYHIACDGAGNQLLDYQLTPHVVIGDLDSFDTSRKGSFKLIQDADQETNDLEKALSYVYQRGAKKAVIIGALGKRLDHTLKNLSVLQRFDTKFDELIIKDEFGISIIARKKIRIEAPTGTIVSLVPISGKVLGVQTKGLKYPLNREYLANGERDGTSNEIIKKQAEIEIESGELLIIISHTDGSPLQINRSK